MSKNISATNLETMDPAEIIHSLSKLSFDAVQEAQPRQEPQTRFQITKQRRLVAWGNSTQSRYNWMMKAWRGEVKEKIKKIQNAWELMDKAGIGPQQLLTHSNTSTKLCRITNNMWEKPTPWQAKVRSRREKAVQEGILTMTINQSLDSTNTSTIWNHCCYQMGW